MSQFRQVNHVTSPSGFTVDEERPIEPETFRNKDVSRVKPLDLSKLSTFSPPKAPEQMLTLRNQEIFEYANPRDSNMFSQQDDIDSGEAMFRKF